MKKYILLILTLILILYLIWYFTPISLDTLLNKHIDVSNVEEVHITIFKTVFSEEKIVITDKLKVKDLIDILGNIKVRSTIQPTSNYVFRPKLYNTYYIKLNKDRDYIAVDIMDDQYIVLGRKTYKIVNEYNLKDIYDIIYR